MLSSENICVWNVGSSDQRRLFHLACSPSQMSPGPETMEAFLDVVDIQHMVES